MIHFLFQFKLDQFTEFYSNKLKLFLMSTTTLPVGGGSAGESERCTGAICSNLDSGLNSTLPGSATQHN